MQSRFVRTIDFLGVAQRLMASTKRKWSRPKFHFAARDEPHPRMHTPRPNRTKLQGIALLHEGDWLHACSRETRSGFRDRGGSENAGIASSARLASVPRVIATEPSLVRNAFDLASISRRGHLIRDPKGPDVIIDLDSPRVHQVGGRST